jgi:hypothetical protein
VSAEQWRQARVLLDWDRPDLVIRATIASRTLKNLEEERSRSFQSARAAIRAALESAGAAGPHRGVGAADGGEGAST